MIYGTGHILARLVTFLLLPLYTNVFTAEEYGVVSLAYVFLGFMSIVLKYGLDVSLMKKYIQSTGDDRTAFFSTAYISLIITSFCFAGLFSVFADKLSPLILDVEYPRFIVYIGWILCFDILWSMSQLILRAEEKPVKYIVLSMANVISMLILNLYFVLKLNLGVEGVLVSNLIVSAGLFLCTLPIVFHHFSLKHYSKTHWQKLMTFGLPFLPAGIFSMLMEIADRYILKWLTDMETVGLYSAGYKLGMLMMLAVMGFNMGWQPYFLKAGEQNKPVFSRIATYVFSAFGYLWLLLYLWKDTIVQLKIGGITFYGEAFWSSTSIVPVIALGYWFHGVYIVQIPGLYLQERSNILMLIRACGALVNVALNFALIPYYGAMGAAWATCISFAVMAVLIFFFNRKWFPMQYEWKRLLLIIISITLIYSASQYLPVNWVNQLIFSAAFPVLLILSGFLNAEERNRLKRIFK